MSRPSSPARPDPPNVVGDTLLGFGHVGPTSHLATGVVTVGAERGDDRPRLVRTKLMAPIPAPGLLSRPTLLDALLASSRFVLVSAPAGWGKTSLISAWRAAESERRRFAFVRFATGDDRPSVFWSYVVEALRGIDPSLAPSADEILREPLVDPRDRLVPALVNALALLDEELVLVFDDYQLVRDERVHAAVVELVDALPPGVVLAIATRADPPFQLARWRASGQLVEMRAGRLAFGVVETETFLSGRFDVDLSAETTRTLWARTEGWPAGLHLAGLSLARTADPDAFVAGFAGDDRNVADYLVGEVISTLDDRRRRFLLRTSVPAELTGPLCDALTDGDDSATVLAELERDGMFVVPLDLQRCWYRYHHLFRDWLQHELRTVDPAATADLHRRASDWHAAEGSFEDAVEHALAVPDADRSAKLIAGHLSSWRHVQWPQTWRWLDQLPDEVIARYPAVALARSRLAFETGEFARGLRWADAAEEGLESMPASERPSMALQLKLWHGLGHLVDGDMRTALALADEVVAQTRGSRSADYASAVGLAGIVTFWLIGPLESVPLLLEASTARLDAGVEDGGVTSLLALAHAEVGDWSAATAAAERADCIPSRDDRNRYPVPMASHYALGMVALSHGDRVEARREIGRGLTLAREWVEPIFVSYGCLLLADACENYAEKRALVREARELVADSARETRITDLVDAAARRLALRQPRLEGAGTVFVEPLTEREVDVLRFLRSDLSLREIAGELHLAHNTVKSYTRSIYRKLGVASRGAAVDAATHLDLV